MHNATTIAPTKARKRAPKAPDLTPLNTLINTITLGEEEVILVPILPLNPTLTIKRTDESLYSLKPLISNNTKANNNIEIEIREKKLV